MRAVRKEYSKRLVNSSPAEMLTLALELRRRGARWVGYELLLHHPTALASLRTSDVERLGQGIDGWAAVDTFACDIAGRCWREGQISNRTVHRWARSKDLWWRRAALVCTVPLNVKSQGGTGDVDRTLAVCELLVADHEKMVVQALSWALRVASTHDAAAVRAFLAKHDGTFAALIKREVQNKLRTGLKNPRGGRAGRR